MLRGAEDDALNLFVSISNRSEEEAVRFSDALDQASHALSQFPELGSRFMGRHRRKLVIGFYDYGVFYSIEGERVVVQASMNLRQNPEQIRGRLGESSAG